MMFDVTREVVSDLWPLYRSGEASGESKKLVDAYLATDSDFAATLKESEMIPGAMPNLRLSPEAERRLLDAAQNRARWKLIIIGGSIGLIFLILMGALAGALMLGLRTFGQ
jgi:hypothetical protein